MGNKVERLVGLALELLEETSGFFEIKGPGVGDKATASFMRALRKRAKQELGGEYSEARVSHEAEFKFDFYFPDEATAVEFAFGLNRPLSEFEKDVFKALLAKEDGKELNTLVFVAKQDGTKRHGQPGSSEIKRFVKEKFGLEIRIIDLLPLTGQGQKAGYDA